jgi:hypothetical protein
LNGVWALDPKLNDFIPASLKILSNPRYAWDEPKNKTSIFLNSLISCNLELVCPYDLYIKLILGLKVRLRQIFPKKLLKSKILIRKQKNLKRKNKIFIELGENKINDVSSVLANIAIDAINE